MLKTCNGLVATTTIWNWRGFVICRAVSCFHERRQRRIPHLISFNW